MSLISFSLRVSHFNIKISINKNPKGNSLPDQDSISFEDRIQRATRQREAYQALYHQISLY